MFYNKAGHATLSIQYTKGEKPREETIHSYYEGEYYLRESMVVNKYGTRFSWYLHLDNLTVYKYNNLRTGEIYFSHDYTFRTGLSKSVIKF